MNDKTTATIERDGFIATLEIDHIRAGDISQLRDIFAQLSMAVGFHPDCVKDVMGELS